MSEIESYDDAFPWRLVDVFQPPNETLILACWSNGWVGTALRSNRRSVSADAYHWFTDRRCQTAAVQPVYWQKLPAAPLHLLDKQRRIAELQKQIDEIRVS